MHGAEDMIVDHNMVVTQVFVRMGKRLYRPCIAAKFDLRINHTSFHRPLPLSRYGTRGLLVFNGEASVIPVARLQPGSPDMPAFAGGGRRKQRGLRRWRRALSASPETRRRCRD